MPTQAAIDYLVHLSISRLVVRPAVIIAVMLLGVLAGCSKPHDGPALGEKPAAQDGAAPRQLAYEHTVSFDAEPERLPAIHATGLAACREAGAAACTLLESRIDSEPKAEAVLKFRARPQVIPRLVAAMGNQAELAHQSTRAEDLSGPIADTGRRLTMLQNYRDRLEDMRNRAGNDIDALIKVNQELAEVQSRLEEADGMRVELAQRVETELLNVTISAERHRPFWKPIGLALRDFSGNLAEGIAYAIMTLPYLLPWIVMIAFAIWAVRRLWRAVRRRAAAREARRATEQAG
jgi:hypothetical protein